MNNTDAALAIVVPMEHALHKQIQDVRNVRDTDKGRNVKWPPHANFFFPFVPAGDLAPVADALTTVCATFPPFSLHLETPEVWPNGLVVVPAHSDVGSALHAALSAKLTEMKHLPPPEKKFSIHFTLAHCASAADAHGLVAELKWTPTMLDVTHLSVLTRKSDTPFSVACTLPLTGTAIASVEANVTDSPESTATAVTDKSLASVMPSIRPADVRFYAAIQANCEAQLAAHPKSRLYRLESFVTDELYDDMVKRAFRDNAGEQQNWNCNACRDFVTRYANLVLLGEDNQVHPLLFTGDLKCEGYYATFGAELGKRIKDACSMAIPQHLVMAEPVVSSPTLNSDFYAMLENQWRIRDDAKSEPKPPGGHADEIKKPTMPPVKVKAGAVLGQPKTGDYCHMSCCLLWPELKLPVSDYATLVPMLERVLVDNTLETLGIAAGLITANELSGAAMHKHVFAWILPIAMEWGTLMATERKDDAQTRSVFLWRHIGSAYVGVVNSLRSGATSVLLASVGAKDPIEETRKKWNTIVDPTVYRMPTAAPTEGNIKQAKEILTKMGIMETDMARTFLTYGDQQWADHAHAVLFVSRELVAAGATYGRSAKAPVKAPVAALAKKKTSGTVLFDGCEVSLREFLDTIVPSATSIEYKTPASHSWCSLITGAPGSVPLFQFHTGTNRASWYVYPRGLSATSHGLMAGAWTRVHLVARYPNQWGGEEKERKDFERLSDNVVVCLDRAHDSTCHSSALFDALLLSSLHPVRSTIADWSSKNPVTLGPSTLAAVAELTAADDSVAASASASSTDVKNPATVAGAASGTTWRSASLLVHPVCGVALGLESQNKVVGGTHTFRVIHADGVIRIYKIAKFE